MRFKERGSTNKYCMVYVYEHINLYVALVMEKMLPWAMVPNDQRNVHLTELWKILVGILEVKSKEGKMGKKESGQN